MHNPIILACDKPTIAEANTLVEHVAPHIGTLKLGLEFFCAEGAVGVQAMQRHNVPIFLDVKLHDIPNTVAGAIRSLGHLGVDMLTIHASGGSEMCKAAVQAANEADKTPTILAVTILTSLDQTAVDALGMQGSVSDAVLRLAEGALNAGIPGLVCSPHEVALLRREFGADPVLVVPGIRPAGSATGDQKRIMTPQEALDAGATHLVIGRPITQSDNPADAAANIMTSLN